MNNINTSKKGDDFERQVYDLLKELLENDELFMNGKKSKIFWKKPYYSNRTNSNVVVDISIETYLNGAEQYSSLTVIECKNYKSKIVLNDIREFSSVLNEIGEHNTKGILITTSSFQQGAYEFAVSSKIGIARVNSNNEIDWISYRKGYKSHGLTDTIIKQILYNQTLGERNFFSFYNSKCLEKFPDLLKELGVIDKYEFDLNLLVVPYLSDSSIENYTLDFPSDLVYLNSFLETEKLCRYLTKKIKVNFVFDKILGNEALGKICFNPLEIFVSDSIKNDIYRWRFTIAHEIGHLMLHKELLCKYIDEQIDNENSLSAFENNHIVINKRLEIQANKFASNLLLPKKPVILLVNQFFKKENLNKGFLHFDRQPVNMVLGLSLLRDIQCRFGVSKEVAKYRLVELKLLHDATDVPIKRERNRY
jgi:Zn-dependent peptidase ImmA (M78 family)